MPVLGVVCSPMSPDRGRDTIAWAEGARAIQRNGQPVTNDLSRQGLLAGGFVWATASSALKPITWSVAAAPARYIAMPSIAYRMARIAAGDGIATVVAARRHEYDIAAGMALIAAANGVVLDAEGRDDRPAGQVRDARERRVRRRAAGGAPARQVRLAPARAGAAAGAAGDAGISAQAERRRAIASARSLLGQVVGDSLGSLRGVQERSRDRAALPARRARARRRRAVPHHRRPADRRQRDGAHARAHASCATAGSSATRCSTPTANGCRRARSTSARPPSAGCSACTPRESESNGSLMRVSPIGIWAAGDPARAAAAAREDSALTHPNPVCVEACAGFCAAIAAGVGGRGAQGNGEGRGSRTAAARRSDAITAQRPAGQLRQGIGDHVAAERVLPPARATRAWKSRSSPPSAAAATPTPTPRSPARCWARCTACEAFPSRWIYPVLACRPLAEAGDPRPRPMPYWPDDVLEVAEALLG